MVFSGGDVVMSQAYKCDICGDFVSAADQAISERQVSKENMLVVGEQIDVGIIIKVYKPHTCDTCFNIILQRVRAWLNANYGS
jgi:hypothetical protein